MCRLYGFLANERTKVECTLVRAQNALMTQSRRDTSGKSHSDGWGIGYYPDGQPVVERRSTAAHEDLHFSLTAERIFTRNVVAHVRHATVGAITPENTHPFVWRRWLFAHNGTIGGFASAGPSLERELAPRIARDRRGTTDSELAFLWLRHRFASAGIELDRRAVDLPALVAALAELVGELSERCAAVRSDRPTRLNFLLANGQVMLASRWNHSLFVVERDGVHDCEVCGIPHIRHESGTRYRAVVIASEPISRESWRPVPEGSVVWVDQQLTVGTQPIGERASVP